MEAATVLILGILLAASVIAALSLLIVKELVQDGETAMVKMQLSQEETISEFRQLLFFHSLVLPALVFVTLSGITENPLFINIGRAMIAVQGIGIFFIFHKWWRRF